MKEVLVAYAPFVSLMAGALTGAYIVRKAQRNKVTITRIEARCGCDHELSFHDPATNECHAGTDTFESVYEPPGGWTSREKKCPCRQYVGPRPIDEVFQPRILPPTE